MPTRNDPLTTAADPSSGTLTVRWAVIPLVRMSAESTVEHPVSKQKLANAATMRRSTAGNLAARQITQPEQNYSYCKASSGLSRDARRAGQIAAKMPTTTETAAKMIS